MGNQNSSHPVSPSLPLAWQGMRLQEQQLKLQKEQLQRERVAMQHEQERARQQQEVCARDGLSIRSPAPSFALPLFVPASITEWGSGWKGWICA